MAKYCPIVEKRVVYIVCQECEEKVCFNKDKQQSDDAKMSNTKDKEKTQCQK